MDSSINIFDARVSTHDLYIMFLNLRILKNLYGLFTPMAHQFDMGMPRQMTESNRGDI